MEHITIKKGTADWDFIWLWLEFHTINEGIDEAMIALNQGEVWEYLGSFMNEDVVISEFQHKCHPKTNTLYTCSIEHHKFDVNSIETRRKIL